LCEELCDESLSLSELSEYARPGKILDFVSPVNKNIKQYNTYIICYNKIVNKNKYNK